MDTLRELKRGTLNAYPVRARQTRRLVVVAPRDRHRRGAEVAPEHLSEMIEDCLQRRLFTVEDAVRRLAEPDLAGHRGAELLRRAIDQIG